MADMSAPAGGVIVCPPFCPLANPAYLPQVMWAINGSVIVSTNDSSHSNIPGSVLGLVINPSTSLDGVWVAAQPLELSVLPNKGIYISDTCDDGFEDPANGNCLNASDPRRALCAFGAPPCQYCPDNALCPGGFRAWPLPGYYSTTESSTTVRPCYRPQFERCLGWNTASASQTCGARFAGADTGCILCARSYYATFDGDCAICPSGSAGVVAVKAIGSLLAAGVLLSLLVYVFLRLVQNFVGGSIEGGFKCFASFAAYGMSLAQLLSQAARTASPGLPDYMRSALQGLLYMQFENVSVPASCLNIRFKFVFETMQMILILVLATYVIVRIAPTHLLDACKHTNCAGRNRPNIGRAAHTHQQSQGQGKLIAAVTRIIMVARAQWPRLVSLTLLVLLPLTYNTVLQLTMCDTVSITVATYLALEQDGTTLTRYGITNPFIELEREIAVKVLARRRQVVCYESNHSIVFSLAIVTGVVVFGVLQLALAAAMSHSVRQLVQQRDDDRGARLDSNIGVDSNDKTEALHQRSSPSSDQLDQYRVESENKFLMAFSSSYRTSRLYFVHIDQVILAALAIIGHVWPAELGGSKSVALASQTAALCLVLLTAMAAVRVSQPYVQRESFKQPVRMYAYVISAVIATLSWLNNVDGGGVMLHSTQQTLATNVLSAILMTMIISILVVLLVVFGRLTLVGAKLEVATELMRLPVRKASKAATTDDDRSVVHIANAIFKTAAHSMAPFKADASVRNPLAGVHKPNSQQMSRTRLPTVANTTKTVDGAGFANAWARLGRGRDLNTTSKQDHVNVNRMPTAKAQTDRPAQSVRDAVPSLRVYVDTDDKVAFGSYLTARPGQRSQLPGTQTVRRATQMPEKYTASVNALGAADDDGSQHTSSAFVVELSEQQRQRLRGGAQDSKLPVSTAP
jgi:hypothetical protein